MHGPTNIVRKRLLTEDPWFSELPSDMQQALFQNMSVGPVDAGLALTHGGDTSGGIVGLVDGTAVVVPAMGPPDAGPIHLFLGPNWFGLLPLSNSRPRAVSVIAHTACTVARVPQARLAALLSAHPGWWQHVNDLSASLFQLAAQIAADLHVMDSRRRARAVILRLAAEAEPRNGTIEMVVSQQDLATMANMSRQTMGLVLRELRELGLVRWTYRTMTVSDVKRLRALVDE